MHRCMGKLSSVSLSKKDKPCKCSAKAKKKMPCCKSESKLAKVNSEHQQVSDSFQFLSLSAILPVQAGVQTIAFDAIENKIAYTANAPPIPKEKLYLTNNVFRI